jgi:hypothetical protein
MNSEPTPDKTALRRVRAFLIFFKGYMGLAALVTASLPIPVNRFQLIPAYDAQSKLLGTYTSLYCFLLLAFIFYSRHFLAQWMFRDVLGRKWGLTRFTAFAPLLLILISLSSVFGYNAQLERSLTESKAAVAQANQTTDAESLLAGSDFTAIRYSTGLLVWYLAIFLSAEAAFGFMAIREYLQDELHISDSQIIEEQPKKISKATR